MRRSVLPDIAPEAGLDESSLDVANVARPPAAPRHTPAVAPCRAARAGTRSRSHGSSIGARPSSVVGTDACGGG